MPGESSFLPLDREAEVFRALEATGIPIPHVWGIDGARDLFLVDRATGVTWFHPPSDPVEAESVAQDFIRHLAAWHRVPAGDLDLPSFGPVKTVREHQLDQLAAIRELTETEARHHPIDPIGSFTVDWLAANVPDVDNEPVLVQGD